eukprot:8460784-Alexandrium_andersonii.AAC.1
MCIRDRSKADSAASAARSSSSAAATGQDALTPTGTEAVAGQRLLAPLSQGPSQAELRPLATLS